MKYDQPETRSQDIGDAQVQYLLYPGSEPTIILLHATGFMPWLWHPIAGKLAGAHRIIAPYFCDHRIAPLEDGGLSWITLARDLAELCRRMKIERPVLVGHSMGATVMVFAQTMYGLGAAGMILIEPIFFPETYYRMNAGVEDHPLASKSLRRRNRWNDSADMKAYLKTKPLFSRWEEEFLDLYIAHGTVESETFGLELTCPPTREAALFMGGMSCDPWPLLPKIQCPTMIIEGAESGNRQYIDLVGATAKIPNGRFKRIDDAGHLIPMEKSGEILSTISEFIRGLQ